ncbi:MAG: carbohydrate ABC transporter permease [Oscillospiraceae bacterium]|nr:carbohydrate ABC transporter permease [Oscillospiraceae bacterium]MDY6207552.1 carbohydrate ABC transporter permease [Oscillospiraceae bacterium]
MSTQMAGTHSNSQMIKIRTTLVTIVMVLLAIISLLPIYILVVNATRTSVDITGHGISFIPGLNLFNNIGTLMDWSATNKIQYDAFIGYKNSGIIAFSTTILTVLFSGMTAYGLVVYDFKLKNIAYTIILAVMMIPVQVTSVGFYQFMSKLGLTDSYLPLIVPAIAAPAVVFFMRQYMKSSFPLEIVEAARIDGCGEYRTFFTIGIPMMKPAFAVQAIFAFVANWNNYYTPSMILISRNKEQLTLPMMVNTIISNDKLNDYGANYAAIMLSIIPVVIVYFIFSKFIVEGVALGGVKE